MKPAEPFHPRPGSARLLAAGVILGPLFYLVVAVEAATRNGFDIMRQPLSLLGLGPGGWRRTK